MDINIRPIMVEIEFGEQLVKITLEQADQLHGLLSKILNKQQKQDIYWPVNARKPFEPDDPITKPYVTWSSGDTNIKVKVD